MLDEDLHQALGHNNQPPEDGGQARNASALRIKSRLIWIAGTTAAAAVIGYAALYGDPHGGSPRIIAHIDPPKPPAQTASPVASQNAGGDGNAPQSHADGHMTAQEVEQNSGVKITRPPGSAAPSSLIIHVDEPKIGPRLNPSPDPRLIEKTQAGLLPRVSADGAKPVDIYARPVVWPRNVKINSPKIAILFTGLGLSPTTTQDAIEHLPPAVSLAFAPYGVDIDAQAAHARDQGHETLLQTPMEPFNANASPPSHMLMANATLDETNAALQWQLGRFQGYIGLTNYLGARFMSNDAALRPVLRELAARGLSFVDDGSSPQSLAPSVAEAVGLPTARADVVLDASQQPAAIEAALARLEEVAREKGSGFGVAIAAPPSIDRIGKFARSLEQRGFVLVPVSAMLVRNSVSTADTQAPRK